VLFVDEREAESYGKFAPRDRLWLHAPTTTIGQVRALAVEHCPDECLVMLDDDFRCVRPLVGDRRAKITDPDAIRQIIENGLLVARDLGLSVFAWNRNPNPVMFQPFSPFGFVGPACGAFGVIGKKFTFDRALIHGEDCDFTLRALQAERIILCDNRYYFDFGPIGSSKGGLQGIRTDERIARDIEKLERRWGAHLSLSDRAGSQNWRGGKGKTGMKIRVQRRNPLAKSG
jgi:hypothetical protein